MVTQYLIEWLDLFWVIDWSQGEVVGCIVIQTITTLWCVVIHLMGKAAQPVRLHCIFSIFCGCISSQTCSSPQICFSSCKSAATSRNNGLLHCLQWLQQATSILCRLLLRWQATQGLFRIRRLCIWGEKENWEEKTPECHLLWGHSSHHWFHRTNWSGSRDGPADVEGNSLHRGEHHRHGDPLGGIMDELLQTSQHQDAV